MNLRALLVLATLLPGALSAQSRTTLSTHVAADASLPGSPVMVGATLARESGALGVRLGAALDAREQAPEEPVTWTADLDGTASPGALVPALRDLRLFAGVGARRAGLPVEPEAEAGGVTAPVVLSTSLGAGYRFPLGSLVGIEAEVRYRVPLPEHLEPGFEYRLGLSLGGGRLRRPVRAVSAPAVLTLPEAAPAAPATALAVARRAIDTGSGFVGIPYKWGGNTPEEGFDCSGFLRYVFLRHGISIPRVSRDQARWGEPLPTDVSALRAGDLMFFSTGGGEVDHVAMYVGEGRILHSSSSGGGVRYDDLSSRRGQYLVSRFVAARRVIPDGAPPLLYGGR